ncbi:MAG: GntR family transcriptional regulator [Clostridiaceae bacterium]
MLDKASAIPLYAQLAERIKAQILSGEIKPGDKLKSEAEMVEEYDVGRLTVRSALSQLVEEGYLEKAQGKGTFCRAAAEVNYLNIEAVLDMGNTYFIPTYYVKGISEVLNANNCNFLISDTNSDAAYLCAQLEQILTKNTSGVIFQLTQVQLSPEIRRRLYACLSAFRNRNIPCIMIDSRIDDPEASYVMLDETAGGARVVEHFAAYGHTRCAVSYSPNCCDALQRYDGFCAAAAEYGMERPVGIDCDSGMEGALIKAVREQGVTGVFGYNDEIALRCMRALRARGYLIPEQVSVIGFDDSYLATTVDPQLTTISHPKEVMGRHTAQALLKQIKKQIKAPYIEIFRPELVKRGSCARAFNGLAEAPEQRRKPVPAERSADLDE